MEGATQSYIVMEILEDYFPKIRPQLQDEAIARIYMIHLLEGIEYSQVGCLPWRHKAGKLPIQSC